MSNIKLFESNQIRSIWNEADQKWYFVVADVIQVLTDTPNPSDYIKKMRKRDEELSKGWGQFVTPLSVDTIGGKQKLNCANAKGLLRIIQSIPSPKAEPFKLWLAQVGSDRLDEIENPELVTQRTRELYKLKGYPDNWIEKRMRSIAICEELTEEWKNRGVKENFQSQERRNRLCGYSRPAIPDHWPYLLAVKRSRESCHRSKGQYQV